VTHQGSSRPHSGIALSVGQLLANALEAGDLAAQGFAAELTDAFEVIPIVTGGELISPPVFTRLVLITAHAKNIDANRHMMANKPV
jgi:hypothetical protein